MIAMGRLRPRWLRRDPGARMRRGGARARTAGEHDDHDRAVSRDRRLKRTPRKWESCSRRSNRSSGRRLSMKRPSGGTPGRSSPGGAARSDRLRHP
jgi:hypothetical protein